MPLTVKSPNDYLTEVNAEPEHGTLILSLFFLNGVLETLAEEAVDDLQIFWPVLWDVPARDVAGILDDIIPGLAEQFAEARPMCLFAQAGPCG